MVKDEETPLYPPPILENFDPKLLRSTPQFLNLIPSNTLDVTNFVQLKKVNKNGKKS